MQSLRRCSQSESRRRSASSLSHSRRMPASSSSCACWLLAKRRGRGISAGLGEGASPAPPPAPPPVRVEWWCWRPRRSPAPLPPAPQQPPALPPLPLLLDQLEGASPWCPALLLPLASRSSQQVRRSPPGGRLRALGVSRRPAPDLWAQQLQVLARAEPLLELSPSFQQGKVKILAGDRTPQLERRRRTCSMRPKYGACHITDTVRAPEDKWRNEKL
jgi:hypothetical protein